MTDPVEAAAQHSPFRLDVEIRAIDLVWNGLEELERAGEVEERRLGALEARLGVAAAKPGPERTSGRSDRPTAIDTDHLLELRRAATATDAFRCGLDLTDLVVAVVAGVAAVAVDLTVVRIPRTMTFDGTAQAGSPLTAALRSRAVPVVNQLSKLAIAPFDALATGGPGGRLSPRTHRADTFGHDPLIGLVYGVIDILRGTSTGVDRDGAMFVIDVADPTTSNPLAALVVELGHLLSDVGTRAGLPLPGWAVLRMIDAGSIHGHTVSETARSMYLRGFDSWHLITMATAPAAADLVLRAGWALRGALDPAWEERCRTEARLAGTTRTGTHPRFMTMGLIAHGIACAGNAAKIAAHGGNPLAWNAAEWARFGHLIARWWRATPRSFADVIARRSDINLELLLDGWPPRSPGV